MESRGHAFRITQDLDQDMAAFGDVELTAIIQGLQVRNEDDSEGDPFAMCSFEELYEALILHRSCRS